MYEKAGKAVADIICNPHRDAFYVAGKAFASAGNDETALVYLQHAALLNPHRGLLYYEMSKSLGRKGDDIKMLKFLLTSALVEEPMSIWEDLLRTARRFVNVKTEPVLGFVMGMVLWVEKRKNVGLRDAAVNELVKRKFDQKTAELVSLLLVYLKSVKKMDGFSAGDLLFGSARILYNLCFESPNTNHHVSPKSLLNIAIHTLIHKRDPQKLPWTIVDAATLLKHFARIKELILSDQLHLVITLQLLRDLDDMKSKEGRSDHRLVMELMTYLDSLANQPSPAILFQSVTRHYSGVDCARYRLVGLQADLHDAVMFYGKESLRGGEERFEVWTESVDLLQTSADFGVFNRNN